MGHKKWSEIRKNISPKEFRLFLDDVREPADVYFGEGGKWVVCRDIEQVKLWLNIKGVVTHLSLDGDMGQMEDDQGIMRDIPGGVELVDWMRHTGNWPTEVCAVHSQNPVKAAVMRALINQYFRKEEKHDSKNTREEPFK